MSMTAALGEAAARTFLEICQSRTLRFGEGIEGNRDLTYAHDAGGGVTIEVAKSFGTWKVHMSEDGERIASFSVSKGLPTVAVGGRYLRIADGEVAADLTHAVGRIAAAAEVQRGHWAAPFSIWAGRSDPVGVEAFREEDGTSWWVLDSVEAREADRSLLGHGLGLGANGAEGMPKGAAYLSLRDPSGERLASALVDAGGVLDLVEREGFDSGTAWLGPLAVGRRIAAGQNPETPLAEGMHRTDRGIMWVDGAERLHNLHGPAQWEKTGSTLYFIGGTPFPQDEYALAAAEAAAAASPTRDGIADAWMAERVAAEIDFMVEETPDKIFLSWNGRRDAGFAVEAIRSSTLETVEDVCSGVRKFLSNEPMTSFFHHALARGWIRSEGTKPSDLVFSAENNGAPRKVVDLMARAKPDDVHGLNQRLHMAIETGRWGDLSKEADASAPPRRGFGR